MTIDRHAAIVTRMLHVSGSVRGLRQYAAMHPTGAITLQANILPGIVPALIRPKPFPLMSYLRNACQTIAGNPSPMMRLKYISQSMTSRAVPNSETECHVPPEGS